MNEYVAMWKNYFNFRERTTVRGYWMAVLFNVIIALLLGVLSNVSNIFGTLSMIYSIAGLIPGIALGVRRLHDINKSGLWTFIAFVPIVGPILLIVWYCFKSVDEGNRFGTEQI
ncbi:MAG TPA: DUF805 domain-containing protein [Lachnoclostridium sp.]|jgi:uncharacterized membrane protein YhaH (DUF805 family)|uniref:DUF805 domain-containing protein n=1 Tax=Lacrimispora sp. TaxID=2719234 RepID=UPI000EC612B6|nr:DUF805 domain-containing protein [Lacrimispora sp.]HCD42227.1 DUF805 domain-containing protein [Lachnoclostridium sp.]